MAGNEVPNPTQLYTGWSSVVHQPFDDFEETDLPSTVDITAFSSALSNTTSVNPNVCNDNKIDNGDSDVDSSNSGSEASHSGSQSDSSDSETSSSTAEEDDSSSSSPSPEFSVTSSQTDGLRLTIASIKKFASPLNPPEKSPRGEQPTKRDPSTDSDSSENERSSSSVRGGRDRKCVPVKSATPRAPVNKTKVVGRKEAETRPKREMRVRKRLTRKSGNNQDDYSMSDDSDGNESILASSCSLQEIRQEDLAAILPDQQECDVFGSFERDGNKKYSPQEGDVSDSEMELPQQAVNALIERTTESSSDDGDRDVPNPNSLYANSLLRQFEAQTQMLSVGNVQIGVSKPQGLAKTKDNQNSQTDTASGSKSSRSSIKNEADETKGTRRGRSTRHKQTVNTVENTKLTRKSAKTNPYGLAPNVSPDSGIPNSPDHISSPEHILNKSNRKTRKEEMSNSVSVKKDPEKNKAVDEKNKRLHKLSLTSDRFDRQLYGHTDRTLYPQRRKTSRTQKKNSLRHHKTQKTQSVAKVEKPEIVKKPVPKAMDKPGNKTHTTVPPKSKSLFLFEICEKVSKRLEQNRKQSENRVGRVSKTMKSKKNAKTHKVETKSFTVLKNAKVVHNKHCHKRHKKCKLTIIRPLSINNNLKNVEVDIEKLISDFNSLNISNNTLKVVKEVPEVLKNVKKVSKKRKTNEFDRKKKKQNISTTVNKPPSSNEQRLPLKKRHYHMSATDNKVDDVNKTTCNGTNEILDKNKNTCNKTSVIHKVEKPKNLNVSKNDLPRSPKAEVGSPRNNIKEEKSVKKENHHIDEAIEACITRFSDKKIKEENALKVEDKSSSSIVSTTTTTPKKRHRLAALSPEVEVKTQSDILQESVKIETSMETVVTELKIKRNASPIKDAKETVNKVEIKPETDVQIITRKKNRLEDLTSNLVSKINPNFDIDKKKKVAETTRSSVIKYPACKKAKPTELEKLNAITSDNPTGIFMPTVEIEDLEKDANSSKLAVDESSEKLAVNDSKAVPSINQKTEVQSPDSKKKKVRKRRAINRTGFPTVKKKKKIVKNEPILPTCKVAEVPNAGERVPRDGEEYTSFLQRTTDSLPEPIEIVTKTEEMSPSKWETMSECDSLPQDERIEMELDDLNSDSNSSRPFVRDDSPALSVSTLASDRSKSKDDYLDDLPLDARLKSRRKKSLELPARENLRKKRDSTVDKKAVEEKDRNKKAPKWKKKYLVAGLFSDYYKEDEDSLRTRQETTKSKNLLYDPAEHPHGLLPPPYHCGRYLRARRLPFQLPYDIWWRHTHDSSLPQSRVPSWNYRKIRTNVYNVKQLPPACDPQNCSCDPANGCGDDCLNRLVYAECPASHRCKNQRIQKHEWAPGLERFMTDDKGWGVRTKLPIRSGEFILEYVGEVVTDQEFKERMGTIYSNDTHHYCLYLDSGTVIDGHRMGGDGRFVNHSCEPNCEMQKWSVNGHFRMALFALRDIGSDEELTYDYNFSLFNTAEGQECKCGSRLCRGVIGGKSQRVRAAPPPEEKSRSNRVGRPRKTVAKKSSGNAKGTTQAVVQPPVMSSIIRPLSHQQKLYILEHRCFLLRNIQKVRNAKDRSVTSSYINRQLTPSPTTELVGASFFNHLNALEKPRNMKTRRIAQAEDNPDLNRSIKLAAVFKDIWSSVTNYKDENDRLSAIPLMNLPSKRKSPEFYQAVENPIDFSTIGQYIAKGVYRTTESFDSDMNRVFSNYIKFYGHSSDIGLDAIKLKKVYNEVKKNNLQKFEDVLGQKPPSTFASLKGKNDEEDIIRCICGMYHDEGLMIQCEKCLVWQHSECVKADASAPSYHCEKCVPREVEYEIAMDEFTEHGHRYYMTLMRGDLQIRQGDTVYVLRDIPVPGTSLKHTYKTIGKISFSELDIFRVERLWKDKDSGQSFAYGHHYLRPHETYHEPTRKFFPNEVMRVPLYEAVPLDLIMSRCWVMDLHTYCKGRPIGAPEEHIYICEYRVDKSARLFHKVSKAKFPISTKSYVFERFAERLKISRTYAPHELDSRTMVKPKGKVKDERPVKEIKITPPKPKDLNEQKNRLNEILLKLLAKLPVKQPVDLSYLLEDSRRRKTKMKTKRS